MGPKRAQDLKSQLCVSQVVCVVILWKHFFCNLHLDHIQNYFVLLNQSSIAFLFSGILHFPSQPLFPGTC